jgi:penicillin-binding protein 1A
MLIAQLSMIVGRKAVLRFLSAVFAGIAVLFVAAIAGALLVVQALQRELPDHKQLARYAPPVTSRVYSGDGRLLAEYADEKRVFLPLAAIPKRVIDAFISAEDKSFYAHPGIDVPGVVRAVLTNIENYGTDRRPIGASTITQQVAKNFLVRSSEVSLERKIKEAILAFRIERAFPKDRILELYLNEIYLGSGAYGVAAAALAYFDKNLDQLSVAEAAFLAGLPKAPSNYDPVRQPGTAKGRRDWVIGRMLDDGRITAEEAQAARETPLVTTPPAPIGLVDAEYFASEVRRDLVRRYGEAALYKGGLTVHSTLDARLQTIADEVMRAALERYDRGDGWRGPVARITPEPGRKGGLPADWAAQLAAITPPPGYERLRLAVVLQRSDGGLRIGFADGTTGTIPASQLRWARPARGYATSGPVVGDVVGVSQIERTSYALRQPPLVQGALVALDPHTGRVLAMTGGYSFPFSQFNRATQAVRQPGSTFKPFVYLAAFEQGYTPSSVINDSRFVAEGAHGRPWVPANYSHRYYGPTTLRVALEHSRNVVAVRLADEVGIDRVVDVARRFGVDDELPPYLSSALGAGETTLMRITAGYGMFVNGGRQIVPTVIDRIQDRYGRIVYRHDPRMCVGCLGSADTSTFMPEVVDDRPQVTDEGSAYQVVSLLEGVVARGTAQKALARVGRPVAGKTGTSNEAKDVWFIGFTPDLVVGVFMGYDDPKSLGDHAAGGTLAAPVFRAFIERALGGTPPTPFRVPSDVRLVRIDAKSGKPSSSRNPNAILEPFKPGTTPDTAVATSRPKRPATVTAGPISGTGGLY